MKTMRRMILLLSLGVSPGCADPQPQPPRQLFARHHDPDSLLEIVIPDGSEPVPAQAAIGKALFDQAKVDYQARRFAVAARGFLEAARTWRIGGFYANGFTGDRRITYRNIASAFSAAGDVAGGRDALHKAAKEDPACADTLAELQAKLAPP